MTKFIRELKGGNENDELTKISIDLKRVNDHYKIYSRAARKFSMYKHTT